MSLLHRPMGTRRSAPPPPSDRGRKKEGRENYIHYQPLRLKVENEGKVQTRKMREAGSRGGFWEPPGGRNIAKKLWHKGEVGLSEGENTGSEGWPGREEEGGPAPTFIDQRPVLAQSARVRRGKGPAPLPPAPLTLPPAPLTLPPAPLTLFPCLSHFRLLTWPYTHSHAVLVNKRMVDAKRCITPCWQARL